MTKHFQEAIKRHFKAAVAQEKGRLTCFQFNATGGAAEHPASLAREHEDVLNGTDVVDMRTLLRFRRQNQTDMPDRLREAPKQHYNTIYICHMDIH